MTRRNQIIEGIATAEKCLGRWWRY